MAPRPFWKGYLKLSLVTCRVAMAPATTASERVHFHTLNRATGNRVESRYVDAVTGKPIDDDDEVRGYESGPDSYVMLEDDELAAVALESTRTIDIGSFVPQASVGWVWYDRPHYLTPDDKVGAEAFAVIRDAMAATGMAGMARLVLYRRERPVMLVPRDTGIVVWTLHYADEVRSPSSGPKPANGTKADAATLPLMKRLIKERTRTWDASMLRDPVQDRLREIIAAKRKGKRPAKARSQPAAPDNVVNIMDALKRSIAAEAAQKR
jgi:DNA end-binding protein Ku